MNAERLEPRQLQRLLEVGRSLVSELDLDAVLNQVLEAARELTGARYAALGVLDAEKRGLERFVYLGIDHATRERIGDLPRGRGILGELIRDPRPLRLSRISDHPRSYGFPMEHPPMTTFLGVPVMIRGEAYGNLYLTEKEGAEEFDELDEQAVVVLAEWAAIAIDNARTHEASERRRRELERAVRGLEANVDLSRQIEVGSRLDRALELVVKRGRALVEARTFAVLLLTDEELRVADAAGEAADELRGRSFDPDAPPFIDALRSGAVQRLGRRAIPLDADPVASMLVPLRSRGENVGLLVAVDRFGGSEFREDDELMLGAFATSAGGAIAGTMAIEDERLRLSIEASEQERRRWARELHDETLQELGALKVLQQSAAPIEDIGTMREALLNSTEQVERMIASLQGLITELRPQALDQLGTAAAIEALIERVRARQKLDINLDIDLDYESGRTDARPDPELEATIYRIVQEAMTNVVKHADAEEARIAVEQRDGQVTLTVEDDGKGIDADAEGTGFGLVGMRERVSLAGGSLEIGPGADGGTRVVARLPVDRSVAEHQPADR